jgi:hypothetical protein
VSETAAAFPKVAGAAAEKQAKRGSHETMGSRFHRAGEFLAEIALDHLSHPTGRLNVEALGISQAEQMRVEPIVFIPVGGVDAAAENFVRRYLFLIHRLAGAIANYETGPGAREVVLL